jgi:flagellar biosynthesis protein FlhG
MPYLIAIASGKGGVGKSFLSANIAYSLSQRQKRTLLVDCDLGGANLHHFLGIIPPEKNIYHFLREKEEFNKLIVNINENLDFLSGSSDVLGMVHIKNYEKNRLLKYINDSDYDYIIIDLGAGSSYSILDMFNAANLKLIVFTPEQTSLENAYGFLKMAYLRGIIDIVKNEHVLEVLRKQIRFKSGGIKDVSSIREKLLKVDNKYVNQLNEYTQGYKTGIVLNMVKQKDELTFLILFNVIVKKYLGFNIEKIGFFPYDTSISRILKMSSIYYNEATRDNIECLEDIVSKIQEISERR